MRLLATLLALTAFVLPSTAAEKFDDPVKLVEYAYQRYVGTTPEGFDENDLWSPRMAGLIATDTARGELASLVFDPFINSQEEFVEDLQINLAVANDKKALVAVGFNNGVDYEQLMLTLVPGPNGFKIDEIEGTSPGHEWKLSDVLAQPL